MTEPSVTLIEEGRLALATLNRPEVRNAIDLDVVDNLSRILAELGRRDEPPILILTGAGDKAFAAGADIGQLRDRGRDDALRRINSALFAEVEAYPVPTIAAVGGWCLGGGCELAIACDLRVAAENARFGQPEVSLGIQAAAGATRRLPRLIGLGRARDLLYTGRIVDAAEALAMGLVNRVVAADRLLDEARELGRSIAAHGTLALRLTKVSLNHAHELSESAAGHLESIAQAILFESQDKHDRMTAFLERKKKR